MRKNRCDSRHIICVLVTLGIFALTFFRFPNAFGRLIESCRDFGLSIGYYVCEVFGIEHDIDPTVKDKSKTPFFDVDVPGIVPAPDPGPGIIPDNPQDVKIGWNRYWRAFIDKSNFVAYTARLNGVMYNAARVISIVIPFLAVLYLLLKRYLKKTNNNYGHDTKLLKVIKLFGLKVYRPLKSRILNFFHFLLERRYYAGIWLVMALMMFNVVSIAVEFFAFYFYFVLSFDVANIFVQLQKLVIDLSAPIGFLPWWVWLIAAIYLFGRIRRKIGYSRLAHMEMCNRGFIKERSIITMVCGTMGKKKTTLVTDMALSQEAIFRYDAFELILENDLKFPSFPWMRFELEIKKAMDAHVIYSLPTCRKWVIDRYKEWEVTSDKFHFWGYEYWRYGSTYDDKLKTLSVWDVLSTYAQLYFIFIIRSSLMLSNYSIRVDSLQQTIGNFPQWNHDFFRRDSRLLDAFSRHSHILDFDALRLGKRVVESGEYKDSFDIGIVVITEIGKERGNNLELQEVKKKTEDTNQKNDLFNVALKMIRHPATVDFYPFVKVFTDEQRPNSWGADARDLTEIIYIKDGGRQKLAMPFFGIEALLHDILFGWFAGFYSNYRFKRGDNTALMYVTKKLFAKLHNYYVGINNTFGYFRMALELESGTLDGVRQSGKYYLMNKKIRANRFATDCYRDFFAQKAAGSKYGIDDLPEYGSHIATVDEFERQHSYFYDGLIKTSILENKENKRGDK